VNNIFFLEHVQTKDQATMVCVANCLGNLKEEMENEELYIVNGLIK